MEQLREQQARRPCPDDGHLGTHDVEASIRPGCEAMHELTILLDFFATQRAV
jgi:hypothetical protein